jgi:hypothetical protein
MSRFQLFRKIRSKAETLLTQLPPRKIHTIKNQTGAIMARKKSPEPFDSKVELEEIRAMRAAEKKRKTWDGSKLQPYLGELLMLKADGASYADICVWLKKNHRINPVKSTVQRFLIKHGVKNGKG